MIYTDTDNLLTKEKLNDSINAIRNHCQNNEDCIDCILAYMDNANIPHCIVQSGVPAYWDNIED